MRKTFHIRDGLNPTLLKDIHILQKKQEPVKSILSDFIKSAEKKAEYQSKRSMSGNETETLAEDRRHVKDMLPFEGTTEVAMKGRGDHGFFTAIYECYNHHWGLKTVPDDWWYTIIRTVAIAIDNHSKKNETRDFFVNFDGKKTLTVMVDRSNGIDYNIFFHKMTNLVQSNIKVEGYVDTIRSDFTTSTSVHRISSEITIMSSMQE